MFTHRNSDKHLSHRLPLGNNLSLLDADNMKRETLIHNRKPKSIFEETTIIEMYEKRITNPSKNALGIAFLVMVLLSGSAFVPLGVALNVSNPMMKVSWRVTNMIPFLGVLGIL